MGRFVFMIFFQICLNSNSNPLLRLFSWSYLWPRWCGRPRIEIDTNIHMRGVEKRERFYFSISQVSFASSSPPPVHAEKGLPLNTFSWDLGVPGTRYCWSRGREQHCWNAVWSRPSTRSQHGDGGPRLPNRQRRCDP